MRIISFGWTVEAFLADAKTCTRRDWKDWYAQAFHKGDRMQAWDKLPRAGGCRIGTIELTEEPYISDQYPGMDYWEEGLRWMEDHGKTIQGVSPIEWWARWLERGDPYWVIRFRRIPWTNEMEDTNVKGNQSQQTSPDRPRG